MTIRARLSFWYAGVLLASVLLMAGVMYFELVVERKLVKAAGRPTEPVEQEIVEIIFFYGLPTALLTIFGGWCLLRKALAPLGQLASAAERLRLDNLHEPLPRTGNGDEVDRLSEVLNSTNRRLEQAFSRIHEFTLHASHELKTPLAILQGEIESALNEPALAQAQRESYASQLDEIQRLTKIVEGLTLLAKADAGKLSLAIEPVRLDELVRDSYADTQILAQEKNITVSLDVCEELIVNGDRYRLRQLLLNLTDNAVKYNEANGSIRIALSKRDGTAKLNLSNTGRGIAPEFLERVFDRFYRGDSSHNSDIDGCGLGLSIAQSIVKAHGGAMGITSKVGKATVVEVELPLQSESR